MSFIKKVTIFFFCFLFSIIIFFKADYLGNFGFLDYIYALKKSSYFRLLEKQLLSQYLKGDEPASKKTRIDKFYAARIEKSKKELFELRKSRILQFLEAGKLPVIDLTSSINNYNYLEYKLPKLLKQMDDLGVAILGFDAKPPDWMQTKRNYYWTFYSHDLINRYPAYFVLPTNRGNNWNWVHKEGTFMRKLSRELKTGYYDFFGEMPFLHYYTPYQCLTNKWDLEQFYVAADGDVALAAFTLARLARIPIYIHVEKEDWALERISDTIAKFPDVKVLFGHYGRILKPHKSNFKLEDYESILKKHPNLYFDLHVNIPNRKHPCYTSTWKSHIWQVDENHRQTHEIDPILKQIILKYPKRFITGYVYRFRSGDLNNVIYSKTRETHILLEQLPVEIQHDIAYRNAWFLLTNRIWQTDHKYMKIHANSTKVERTVAPF